LDALEAAAHVWREKGAQVDVEAAFIEKEDSPYADLKQYIDARQGIVKSFTRHGEFETFVPELQKWLGNDAGLIFVDPTGWKGAAMRFIAPLVAGASRRDVLVNVMFDHINRFKDDTRAFLRTQMSDFFGLGNSELPNGLDEEQLFALYRAKLKELCRIPHAADLAIPHPTMARTKFRLVVGGKAPEVLSLFRDIEKKVIGREAAVVRETAAVREGERRTGQLSLLEAPPATDAHYDSLHDQGIRDAPDILLSKLEATRAVTFGSTWPAVLESLHVTRTELGQVAWELHKRGEIRIANVKAGERATKDSHLLLRK
jgi:three-Cys-motif partner protein